MPRYDYRCAAGHTREVAHAISESPDVFCSEPVPDCDYPGCDYTHRCDEPMQRVIGSTSFIPCSGMYAAENRIAVH